MRALRRPRARPARSGSRGWPPAPSSISAYVRNVHYFLAICGRTATPLYSSLGASERYASSSLDIARVRHKGLHRRPGRDRDFREGAMTGDIHCLSWSSWPGPERGRAAKRGLLPTRRPVCGSVPEVRGRDIRGILNEAVLIWTRQSPRRAVLDRSTPGIQGTSWTTGSQGVAPRSSRETEYPGSPGTGSRPGIPGPGTSRGMASV